MMKPDLVMQDKITLQEIRIKAQEITLNNKEISNKLPTVKPKFCVVHFVSRY